MSKLDHFARVQRAARSDELTYMHKSIRKRAMLRLPEVKATFALLPPSARKNAFISLDNSTITVASTMKNLTSFKDPRLVRVLTKANEWGTPEQTRDWPNEKEPERDYSFWCVRDGTLDALDALLPKETRDYFEHHYVYGVSSRDPLKLRFTIYAYVKEDSPTCRSVIVRTEQRVITDVIREIMCK
jgi:hypothetical protein